MGAIVIRRRFDEGTEPTEVTTSEIVRTLIMYNKLLEMAVGRSLKCK